MDEIDAPVPSETFAAQLIENRAIENEGAHHAPALRERDGQCGVIVQPKIAAQPYQTLGVSHPVARNLSDAVYNPASCRVNRRSIAQWT